MYPTVVPFPMDGGSLQPYAAGLGQYAAPELAIVVLFLLVSGMLAVLLVRQVVALLRTARRAPPKPPAG